MSVRRPLLLAAALVLTSVAAAACGSSGTTAAPSAPVDGTVPGVGVLPAGSRSTVVSTVPPRPTTTLPPELQVGASAAGNRVLLIGDSLVASTARRYSDTMCTALVPLGWRVEVDAETSRFIEFGREVLDARLAAGWDVVVIMLGNNYRGDQEAFRASMVKLVDRLEEQRVVLLTVTEFEPSRAEVNEVVRELADAREHVSYIDWAATTLDAPELVGADGLHLSPQGREALAANVALALGDAPVTTETLATPARCLPSVFTDDSAGSVDGPTTTAPRRRPSTTTTTTTTTVVSSTTKPVTSSTTQTTGPPPTQIPADPPATDPPATDPDPTTP